MAAKKQLEEVREKLLGISKIDPTDVHLNNEIDSSIQWIEYALMRLEDREDEEADGELQR